MWLGKASSRTFAPVQGMTQSLHCRSWGQVFARALHRRGNSTASPKAPDRSLGSTGMDSEGAQSRAEGLARQGQHLEAF